MTRPLVSLLRVALGCALFLALIPPAVAGKPPRRAVVFEPCTDLLAQGLAPSALEQVARERSFILERVRPTEDVHAWLKLLADPPAALYMHTLTNREVMAVACFKDRRSRDFALNELASSEVTRGMALQRWHYTTGSGNTYVIAHELTAVANRLRDSDTIFYLHREADPRAILEASGFRVSRGHDEPQPPVNHFIFVKRFFQQWLEDPAAPEQILEDPLAPSAAASPDLRLWPAVTSVVLPIGEIWITVQNTGPLSFADLAFGTVAGSSRLQVQALGRFPEELAPGEIIDIPLIIEARRPLPNGDYLVPFFIGATVAGSERYEKYGHLEVVGDQPPQIMAPSSIEFAWGEEVEILARDRDRRAVHLEAFLPQGTSLDLCEDGAAKLRFARHKSPGVAQTTITLLAWAGTERHTARFALHAIEIVGGDRGPTPWLLYAALFGLGLFLLFFYLRERVAYWRSR